MTLPDDVEEDLDRYLDRHPDATVPEVLGKFLLDPEEHADAVAEVVEDRGEDDEDPLDQYEQAGYAYQVGDEDPRRAAARDAAVALTASRWGPPHDTPVCNRTDPWADLSYKTAAAAVEEAIVEALLADPEGDEPNPADGQATLGQVAE